MEEVCSVMYLVSKFTFIITWAIHVLYDASYPGGYSKSVCATYTNFLTKIINYISSLEVLLEVQLKKKKANCADHSFLKKGHSSESAVSEVNHNNSILYYQLN